MENLRYCAFTALSYPLMRYAEKLQLYNNASIRLPWKHAPDAKNSGMPGAARSTPRSASGAPHAIISNHRPRTTDALAKVMVCRHIASSATNSNFPWYLPAPASQHGKPCATRCVQPHQNQQSDNLRHNLPSNSAAQCRWCAATTLHIN